MVIKVYSLCVYVCVFFSMQVSWFGKCRVMWSGDRKLWMQPFDNWTAVWSMSGKIYE